VNTVWPQGSAMIDHTTITYLFHYAMFMLRSHWLGGGSFMWNVNFEKQIYG